MTKYFLMAALLTLAVHDSIRITQLKNQLDTQVTYSEQLQSELELSNSRLKTSLCVLDLMTKISQKNEEAINSLDVPCRFFQSNDEIIACVNQHVRIKCGL